MSWSRVIHAYHRPTVIAPSTETTAALAATAIRIPKRHSPDLTAAWESVAAAVRDGAVPSAVMGVADASGTLEVRAFPGPAEPTLTTDSLFFLASVTKPIVATAVMQLVDEGRLDLHAPISRVVPEFQGPGKEAVTAWHVLTHTSGVPDVDQTALRRSRPSAAQMLQRVCREPLSFEPGSRYSYASDSFYLLAGAITRITGMPFPEALRRRVLAPVSAFDISFDPRRQRSRIVLVHGIPLGNRIVRELILRFLARATLPGGGLWGNAEDLLRFGRAMLPLESGAGPRLLSQAAIDEMTREQTAGIIETSDDGAVRVPHYALGWGKPNPEGTAPSVLGTPPDSPVRVPASPSSFTHGGAAGTRLWIDPDRELVFVFLTNQWGISDASMFATLGEVYEAWDAAA
jgi:CubicO group peptidase (beta-lactamase class C family)